MRLSNSILNQVQGLRIPSYNRSLLKSGILHFGVGGFHRAHQAVYTHEVLEVDPSASSWGICGVGIRDNDVLMRDVLKSQDYLYSLLEKSPVDFEGKVIGSIHDFLISFEDPRKLLDKLSDESTKIVMLTITEKGYCCIGTDLVTEHPDIVHDLTLQQSGIVGNYKTAIGWIVAGLKERMNKQLPGYTVQSCDNLECNGTIAKGAVMQYISVLGDTDLSEWVEENCKFPNSMVDRITPLPTVEDQLTALKKFGFEDKAALSSEDWLQWVIEDDFCNGRPAWEKAGAMFVKDVLPYEFMKLRLLNGSHQAFAYPAYLAGFTEVDVGMANPAIKRYLTSYMEEVRSTVPQVPGIDLVEYSHNTLERFSNPNIKDTCLRLCEDSWNRFQVGVIPVIQDKLAKGEPVIAGALGIAAWAKFLTGVDLNGKEIPLNDNNLNKIQNQAFNAENDPKSFIAVACNPQIAESAEFVENFRKMLVDINTSGSINTIEKYIQ
jgi:mannitol 2-dehydrogenase